VPAWTVTEWPLREQSDDLLAELHAFGAPLHAEATPDDPRPPLEAAIAEARHLPATVDGRVLVARDTGGAIAGVSWCTTESLAGLDHVLRARIEVLPALRRRGLGRLLLRRSADYAEERGLRVLTGWARENVPAGGAFARRFGAEAAMQGEENRLDLRACDRDLVRRWIAEGPVRAPGYRLIFVAGPTPPELAQQAAAALNIMNTAPREGLDMGDVQITADLLAEYERAGQAAGKTRWAYYAEGPDGGFVGLTDVQVDPRIPDRVWVGDTAVDPAHRGRGIGKWLKAAITERLLDERPGIRWVLTHNAGSNDAMLAINRQLGFRAAFRAVAWQVSVARLRAILAGESGGTADTARIDR
jgi:mycothiol synthase